MPEFHRAPQPGTGDPAEREAPGGAAETPGAAAIPAPAPGQPAGPAAEERQPIERFADAVSGLKARLADAAAEADAAWDPAVLTPLLGGLVLLVVVLRLLGERHGGGGRGPGGGDGGWGDGFGGGGGDGGGGGGGGGG
jgi:hypothetical protein